MTDAEPPHRRPPWSPEADPWPPQGGRGWRNGPPPLVRRLFVIIPLALLALFVLVVAIITLVFWLVASHMAGAPFNTGPGFRGPGFGIFLLLFVGVMFLFVTGVARAVRRAAM